MLAYAKQLVTSRIFWALIIAFCLIVEGNPKTPVFIEFLLDIIGFGGLGWISSDWVNKR